MQIKKVLILLLIPLCSDMLVACCDCDDPQLFKYTNASLELQHLDNRGQSPATDEDGIALKEAYGIAMTLRCEPTVFKTAPFSLFLNQSYAFSCRCDAGVQHHAKDSVIAIRIITLEDFDAFHPAGTDISDYFRLYTWNNFTTIADYLHKDARVFAYDEPKNIVMNALLINAPAAAGFYRFRVEMDLSDGRSLTKETSTIELQ
ncbi:MAG: DUF5034 domain-containing protein [Chitinophagaceae bacterium]|nr:DUF5034 domain-containing protein [Chitinophagaceae bacterium]